MRSYLSRRLRTSPIIEGESIVPENFAIVGQMVTDALALTFTFPGGTPAEAQSMSQCNPLVERPAVRSHMTFSTPPSTGQNFPN